MSLGHLSHGREYLPRAYQPYFSTKARSIR